MATQLDHSTAGAAGRPGRHAVPPRSGGAPPRRLSHFFERSADATPSATALVCGDVTRSYAALDAEANRLAHHLADRGAGPGSTIGILVDRSLAMYVAILGALKSGATYVPIDPAAPADRVAFIVSDADVRLLVTTSGLAGAAEGLDVERVVVDAPDALWLAAPADRPDLPGREDTVAYVIYTSGSTGQPKGVAVAHSSICNFVDVASRLYGVRPSDRVYQGMSISFDFSLEEIWTTWATGATLVAGPTDGRKIGPGLADFLQESGVTFLHAVPTVLSTLDRTLPTIHTLNLGGEAVPQEIVERWGHGRRILNTYGPTECTASCTWAELQPGQPVTIGKPLPTYGATLRDPETFEIVPHGEVGELCITGVGVAVGYVGRPDLTAEKFVLDEEGRRTYRTGDLGRLDADGNIVYLGRKDAEVKVRGHRVDLGEIEGVLLEGDVVGTAVVALAESDAGGVLVAYLVPVRGVDRSRELAASLHDQARKRLPPYMVPDHIEFVDEIPLMPSGKPDRKALPPPVSPRLVASGGDHVAAASDTEVALARVWAEVLNLPSAQVSVGADLFTDLGGHSLLAATLVSRLRGSGLPGTDDLSIPDLYANPTIRGLSTHLDAAGPGPAVEAEALGRARHPFWRVWLFGAAQALWLYVVVTVSMLPIGLLYVRHQGSPSLQMIMELVLTVPVSYLFARWVLPLVAARALGRGITEGDHPLYGWTHLKVWLVQRTLTLSPLPHLTGSHWMAGYLRALGARVGEGCHIGTAQIPLPAMLEVGDNVTVGYETHLRGFEVVDGRLRVGRVVIEDDASVDASSLLAGPCRVGRGTVLCAQSLLDACRQLPAGQVWAGSPAVRVVQSRDPVIDTMRECADAPRSWAREHRRRFVLGIAFLEFLPLLAMLPIVVAVWLALMLYEDGWALVVTAASGPAFVVSACGLILWFRRFALVRTPVGVHHLRSSLGVEKWFGDKLLAASLGLTNQLYGTLYTPHWLRMLDANVGRGAEIATIANIDPDLLTLGDGTFVADMASVGSATYANGHVAFRRTVVEDRAFVGNASFIPSGSRLGSNSLVGVLSTPPTWGVRPGTSWLGNPAMFLPKREMYEEFTEETTFTPPRWKVVVRYIVEFFRVALPPTLLALSTFGALWVIARLARIWPGWAVLLVSAGIALAGSLAITLVVAALKWLIVGRYRPRVEPLWGNFVRRTEFVTGVYETTVVPVLFSLLAGTPMLGPLLRLFGTRVGRRTLIDTTYLTEFDLVRIGDDVTVGTDVSLQTHLFEDRVMKTGEVRLDAGSSVASRAVVLYGAQVGSEARVHPLTLVMKGEFLPGGTQWVGVPARRHRTSTAAAAAAAPGAVAVPNATDAMPAAPAEVPTGSVDLADVPHAGEDPSEVPPPRRLAVERIVGIDVARGLALLGMMVIHLIDPVTEDGLMPWSWRISAGNSAALFATLAGVGIALSTGRMNRPRGRLWVASGVTLLVRAAAIGVIGLALGALVPVDVANVILPFYAVLFVLAIPFLRVRASVLGVLSLVLAVGVPVSSHLVRAGLPHPEPVNLTFASLAADPWLTVQQLFLTGTYPALSWLVYVLAGLAIGRLGMGRWVALWLAVGGATLAGLVALANWVVLHPLGGLQRLADAASGHMSLDDFTSLLVWGATGTLPADSAWWLVVLAPHTTTPFDLLFTLGVAAAVLGLCMMLGTVIPDVVQPLALLGSMPLTMYAAHLVMTALVPLSWDGWLYYGAQVIVLWAFAVLWSRAFRRGPLEALINVVVRAVARPIAGKPVRGGGRRP